LWGNRNLHRSTVEDVTEQQPYEVVRAYEGFELRRYPAFTMAEVTIASSFEQAGSSAFRLLFAYISGANRVRASIEMTSPVVQAQKVAMTAPVVQHTDASGEHIVAFVLPAGLTVETAPEPSDPRVKVVAHAGGLAAATRYSGRWSQASYQGHCTRLESAIALEGFRSIGPPRFARFDPPFKPWFLRRNEVVIDVADPTYPADAH